MFEKRSSVIHTSTILYTQAIKQASNKAREMANSLKPELKRHKNYREKYDSFPPVVEFSIKVQTSFLCME